MTAPIDVAIDEAVRAVVDEGLTFDEAMDRVRVRFIEVTLQRTHGNVTDAARRLGIHRNTIHNIRRRDS